MFGNFFTKRVAISAAAFAVVAVGGIATVSIIPALAAGVTGGNGSTLAATPAPGSAKTGHTGAKAVAARRIALALFRESVKETGLSRTVVLKDLLNGETLAQIDGSKTQAVETAVMAKITTRLNKAVTNGKITKTQATALSSAATVRHQQADEPEPQHLHPRPLRRIRPTRPRRRPPRRPPPPPPSPGQPPQSDPDGGPAVYPATPGRLPRCPRNTPPLSR